MYCDVMHIFWNIIQGTQVEHVNIDIDFLDIKISFSRRVFEDECGECEFLAMAAKSCTHAMIGFSLLGWHTCMMCFIGSLEDNRFR